MRLTTTPVKIPVKPVPAQIDSFTEKMKMQIDIGILAHTPAMAFKTRVIELVQSYSADIAHLNEKPSELFLDLCDLLVSGKLSKMPDEIFKTYMVVMTYSCTPEKLRLKDWQSLKEMTGIADDAALDSALQRLKDDGYLESVEEPIVKMRPRAGKAKDDGIEKFF